MGPWGLALGLSTGISPFFRGIPGAQTQDRTVVGGPSPGLTAWGRMNPPDGKSPRSPARNGRPLNSPAWSWGRLFKRGLFQGHDGAFNRKGYHLVLPAAPLKGAAGELEDVSGLP